MTCVFNPHADLWHYFDTAGKEYTQAEFNDYLRANFPPRYAGDYATAHVAEVRLTEKEGWRKVRQPYPPKPPLGQVAGKFLLVGQHAEPAVSHWDATKGDWIRTKYRYDEIDANYWETMCAYIHDEKVIQWGHSCWLIKPDGELVWVGADYDTSD